MDTTIAAAREVTPPNNELSYIDLNASLRFLTQDGKLNLKNDREAVRQYFLQHVNQNTVFFHSLREKLDYLVEHQYYDPAVLAPYDFEFIKARFKQAYAFKFRFRTYIGAMKYYTGYNLRTFDGKRYLERFEDRVVMNALTLADGDLQQAEFLVDEMMNCSLQPATPTFN